MFRKVRVFSERVGSRLFTPAPNTLWSRLQQRTTSFLREVHEEVVRQRQGRLDGWLAQMEKDVVDSLPTDEEIIRIMNDAISESRAHQHFADLSEEIVRDLEQGFAQRREQRREAAALVAYTTPTTREEDAESQIDVN